MLAAVQPMIGSSIGPFEVLSTLGAGGMGQVYRARDTKLGREVALKVLPQIAAADPDRVARFRREAQVLAALSHPHIAAIHGLEEADGVPVLVLELVEGPTLADRIAAGPLPIDEALDVARQIAEAIEAAHDQGVVHRDLKPANVKLRPDGVVKVLDFGLAKLVDPIEGARAGARPDVAESPTVTSPAATRWGVILGTAPYMSPEQARGLAVGPAADIWAWGCVLFEMLAGARAFDGADATEAIAAVIRGDPDWSRLPLATPPAIRSLLRRCLEKDPRRREAHIRDARFVIEDVPRDRSGPAPQRAGMGRERLAWVAALVLCLAAGALAVWKARATGAPAIAPETHLEIATPPTTDPVSLAISPDAQWLAFVASSDGRSRLWLRSLRTGEAKLLPGTDGAQFPFWKPDSRSIGFFASERVYRIDVDGGSLKEIGRAPVTAGGTWNASGDVLFTIVPDGPIMRVPEMGGTQTETPGSTRGQGGQRFPQFLPDGRHFLYYMAGVGTRGVYVGSLDSPDRQRLFDADAAATLLPPDEILFLRAGVLYRQHFDYAKLTRDGDAARVAQGIALDSTGAAAVSATDRTIVFRSGAANRLRQLAWFDRGGQAVGPTFPQDPHNLSNPALSTDDRSVVVSRTVDGNADLWLLDLNRPGVMTRITTAPTPDIGPALARDGRLAYASASNAPGFKLTLKARPAPGGDGPLGPMSGPGNLIPLDWSRDGRFLLYRVQSITLVPSLFALPVDGTGPPIAVANTSADERTGAFSPDGKWVAIESNESGRFEVYVQPFPGPGVKVTASAAGGRQPRWAPEGSELYYVALDAKLMSVPFRVVNGRFEPGQALPLFLAPISSTPSSGSNIEYAVSHDGKRFLMDMLIEQAGQPVSVILNVDR
jgi:Tol biopolymer transport system component